jgi:hypothetical protein
MTREQAYAQAAAFVADLKARTGAALDGWENDFQGAWNNASRDSGAYNSGPNGTAFAGSIYDRTWAQVFPDFQAKQEARAASTSHRTEDSQSAAGNLLYGSGTGNQLNIPGAPTGAERGELGQITGYQPAYVAPQPPALASAVTTLGATAPSSYTPAVGPTGLAYQDDPINYATMQRGERFGYSGGDTLPSGLYSSGYDTPAASAVAPSAGGGSSLSPMTMLVLAGAAVAAFLLLKK